MTLVKKPEMVHFVDWFRCQVTAKVRGQGVTGEGVKSEGGGSGASWAGIWECAAGQSVPTVRVTCA